MSKAYNRAQDEKALKKAIIIAKKWLYEPSPEQLIKKANHLRHNRKQCSCEMCCNPRRSKWLSKNMKITQQERRAQTIEEYKNEQ